jgi:hypothetical protein
MREFCAEVFLPTLKQRVQAGLSYAEVQELLKIPATWGAKMSGKQFEEWASKFLGKDDISNNLYI